MKKMQLVLLLFLSISAQAETLTENMINFFQKQTPWVLEYQDNFNSHSSYEGLEHQFVNIYQECFLEFKEKYGLVGLKIEKVLFGYNSYRDIPMVAFDDEGVNTLYINIFRGSSKKYCLETLSRMLNENYGRL